MTPETDWSQLPGRLVVISGASGSGKSTLVQHLLARPELAVAAIGFRDHPKTAAGRTTRVAITFS